MVLFESGTLGGITERWDGGVAEGKKEEEEKRGDFEREEEVGIVLELVERETEVRAANTGGDDFKVEEEA